MRLEPLLRTASSGVEVRILAVLAPRATSSGVEVRILAVFGPRAASSEGRTVCNFGREVAALVIRAVCISGWA